MIIAKPVLATSQFRLRSFKRDGPSTAAPRLGAAVSREEKAAGRQASSVAAWMTLTETCLVRFRGHSCTKDKTA